VVQKKFKPGAPRKYARCEALAVAARRIVFFLDATPCSVVAYYRSFRESSGYAM
jgi:hypothetical protein